MLRKLLRPLAITLSVASFLLLAPSIFAVVQSSIEGGDIYRVRNVTKGGTFADPVNADACDTLQYKVRIHNPGPTETLHNVTVQAVFQTAASTQNKSLIIIKAPEASPSNTSDTATVNLSTAQTVTFISGSAQLLDANGAIISSLSDAIVGGGVNIGSVGISLNQKRFVQFKAKVNCPKPPEQPPEKPPEKPPEQPKKVVKKVIVKQEQQQRQEQQQTVIVGQQAPPRQPPPAAPAALPEAGTGDIAGIFVSVAAAGNIAYYIVYRRLAPLF